MARTMEATPVVLVAWTIRAGYEGKRVCVDRAVDVESVEEPMSGNPHKGIRMSAITTDVKCEHLPWTEFRKYLVHLPERDLVGRNVWWLMEPEKKRIQEWTEARLASKGQTGTP